ncbi:DUF302 domain-containing protein [Sulfurovum sp. bin170]|uniref:DUF302 domain-containing protein n=1 Tax=Sulfurovum sp. bin170 TaxID=2695268 RepID=UPI0013DF1B8D|nr:DUF302 domain-containing protein [Sulfurovum sp. bin170]NEW61100.1 DUF302 domain-containing protein [Sulfurovum sp. bin170]
MNFLKNTLALIGLMVTLAIVTFFVKYGESAMKMDPAAFNLYMKMGDDVLTTGDPAKGMILKRKLVIEEGSTKEEAIENAIEIMDEVGEEYGLAKVDQKTMPREGGLYTHIRSYCSTTIADKFLAHSGEFIGFMPCRVGIVEDVNGDIWLYTMALDMMISGGHTLPDELLNYAKDVREGMVKMMEKAAAGEI